jgi:hypothetical protein
MVTYPIVGLRYISKNSANMDWDFIVTVLSCVYTSDHKSVIVYEWEESKGSYSLGMNEVSMFNARFDKYKEA